MPPACRRARRSPPARPAAAPLPRPRHPLLRAPAHANRPPGAMRSQAARRTARALRLAPRAPFEVTRRVGRAGRPPTVGPAPPLPAPPLPAPRPLAPRPPAPRPPNPAASVPAHAAPASRRAPERAARRPRRASPGRRPEPASRAVQAPPQAPVARPVNGQPPSAALTRNGRPGFRTRGCRPARPPSRCLPDCGRSWHGRSGSTPKSCWP